MRRLAMLAGLCAALCSAPAVHAATLRSVQFDVNEGRVGGLKLGSAKAASVIKRFGTPRRQYDEVPGADAGTRRLVYSCGTTCNVEVQLDADDTLQLVWAYQRQSRMHKRIRTRAGSYLGILRGSAERREGKLMRPGCVTGLTRTVGDIRLEVSASGRRVDSITMATSNAYVLC